jgi:hypothetical protein
MFVNNFSSITTGWAAIVTGIAGLLGFLFIILFFTVGQPFGTLNDIFIGLTAILSVVLIWMLYPRFHTQSPLFSQVTLLIALLGALIVVVGSTLVISGIKGWYLSGLYMAVGNAMIGVWLLGLSWAALRGNTLPHNLALFSLICGVFLALGLVAIPGIFRGLDTGDYKLTAFNAIMAASALGYLGLYPIWSILLGRMLLIK